MRIRGMEHESSIELSPEDRARLEGWVLDRVRPENSRKGRLSAKSVRITALAADYACSTEIDFTGRL